MLKGRLYVVSGPSGVGKGTILKALFQKYKKDLNIEYSVSATTRSPRSGEVNGQDYFFITKDDFRERVENNEFIEWAMFSDNCYGTLKNYVNNRLDLGKNLILEVEPQGAIQIMNLHLEASFIFIAPPSLEELANRLKLRGTEDDEQIAKRGKIALWEMENSAKYDHIVVNDTIDYAVEQLVKIIKEDTQ